MQVPVPQDRPIVYPSRGLLRIADAWAKRGTGIVFCLGVALILFHISLNDPLSKPSIAASSDGKDTILTVTALWMVAALLVVLGSWWLPQSKLFFTLREGRPRTMLTLRVVLGVVSSAIPIALFLVMPGFGVPIPSSLSIYLWPVFIPGLMLLVDPFNAIHLPAKWLSHLSWLVILYTTLAMGVVLFAAQNELSDAVRLLGNSTDLEYILRAALAASVVIVPAVWTGNAILVTYYLIRRADLDRQQASLLFQISKSFAMFSNPLNALPEIAALLHTGLQFERVRVLRPDQEYYLALANRSPSNERHIPNNSEFMVVAEAGEDGIREIGFRFPMTNGLSYLSLRTGKSQLVNDVRRCSDFVSGPSSNVASELNVPVFDMDRPNLLLATLVAQSSQTNAFTWRDQAILETVGEYLHIYSRDLRNPVHYDRLQEQVGRINECRDSTTFVTQLLRSVLLLFNTPHVAFLPLGLGTGLPLSGGIASLPTGFIDTRFLEGAPMRSAGSPLLRTVESLKPLFVRDAQEDSIWGTWASSEKIQALALLPIGQPRHELGLLLVGFRDLPHGFSSSLRLFLTNFTQSVTPQLRVIYYLERLYDGFISPTIDLHRFLREENLGRDRLDYILGMLDQNALITVSDVRRMVISLNNVIRRVYAAQLEKLPDFDQADLRDEMDTFERRLQVATYYAGCKITFRIDQDIEKERADLKVVLYRVMIEAIVNALTHGRSVQDRGKKQVWVRLARLKECTELTVVDRGGGFYPADLEGRTPQPGSILALEQEIVRYCGGSTLNWGWTKPGVGTFVRITIPLFSDPNAPKEVVVHDWIDEMQKVPDNWRDELEEAS